MKIRDLLVTLPLIAFAGPGCGEKAAVAPDGGDEGNDDAAQDADDGGESTTTQDDGGETPDTAEEGGTTTGDEDDGTDTNMFVIPPDGGPMGVFECDPWAQDCPAGEKCMPWASMGGTWDATRCSEVAQSPGQSGDSCTVEGNGATGIDDCDIGNVCWNVDPETNMGTCVPQCQGTEENSICEDPDQVCSIANGGAITLCLASCDPILQSCSEGEACYPIDDDFACAPDVSGTLGAFGDACEFLNVCDPGLICIGAASLSDCSSANGCCSSVCDIDDPDSDAACQAQDAGTSCEPWYEEGQAPPGSEAIGVCAIAP